MESAELVEMYRTLLPIARVDFGKEVKNISGRIQRILDLLEQFEKRKQQEVLSPDDNLDLFSCDGSSIYSLGLPGPAPIPGLDTEHVPHPDLIRRCRVLRPKVILNVGGVRHEVMWKMLERKPRSRLGKLCLAFTHEKILELCDAYSLHDNEYFFDRHPQTFNCILNFYRTGRLHVMDEMCVVDYSEDLQYWNIDEIWLEQCCENKFNTRKDFITDEMKKVKAYEDAGKEVYEDFGDGKLAKYQRILWDTFEKPHKSALAKYISLLSISLVLLSTVGMCLNTMPSFRHYDSRNQPIGNPNLALIEAVCISWFTIEYLLRLAGAPGKLAFLKQSMNVIDALAIAPYYVSLMFFEDPETISIPVVAMGPGFSLDPNLTTTTTLAPTNATIVEAEEGGGVFGDVSRIIQVFRIARIMRIFKLARRSVGLQAIAHTMKSSYKELGLLLMFVGMGMLIFGSLCYFAEKDVEDSAYTSIPQSMWWAIQTLTSVGYGDLSPTTVFGKLVGCACAVSGVLVMALPIPIVVENFASFYDDQKLQQLVQEKKDAAAAAAVHQSAALVVEVAGLVGTMQEKPGPFPGTPESPVMESEDSSNRSSRYLISPK